MNPIVAIPNHRATIGITFDSMRWRFESRMSEGVIERVKRLVNRSVEDDPWREFGFVGANKTFQVDHLAARLHQLFAIVERRFKAAVNHEKH